MSEIEKLYINANVEKEWKLLPYGDIEEYYPEFTAKKQLSLIKWLAYEMHITIGKGLPWGQYDDNWWTITSKKGYSGMNAYKLEEALAQIVNAMWQDLTDTEKAQIKEILNG